MEGTGQELGYNQLTDYFEMTQPEVANTQLTFPEIGDTEETRQEVQQPIINLDWANTVKFERVRFMSSLQFVTLETQILEK